MDRPAMLPSPPPSETSTSSDFVRFDVSLLDVDEHGDRSFPSLVTQSNVPTDAGTATVQRFIAAVTQVRGLSDVLLSRHTALDQEISLLDMVPLPLDIMGCHISRLKKISDKILLECQLQPQDPQAAQVKGNNVAILIAAVFESMQEIDEHWTVVVEAISGIASDRSSGQGAAGLIDYESNSAQMVWLLHQMTYNLIELREALLALRTTATNAPCIEWEAGSDEPTIEDANIVSDYTQWSTVYDTIMRRAELESRQIAMACERVLCQDALLSEVTQAIWKIRRIATDVTFRSFSIHWEARTMYRVKEPSASQQMVFNERFRLWCYKRAQLMSLCNAIAGHLRVNEDDC